MLEQYLINSDHSVFSVFLPENNMHCITSWSNRQPKFRPILYMSFMKIW